MELLEQKHLALLDESQRRGQPGTDNMRLCFEVLALAASIDRACAARLAPHHLSEGRFVLLLLLRDMPEGLAPHELAERAGVTRATVTGLLDGLERDGLLARHADKDDRRRVSVRLTDKGQAIAVRLVSEHSEWIASLFAGFNRHEHEVFSALLRKVWRNIDIPTDDSAAVAARSPQ